MHKDFNYYLEAKICLCKMVSQFLTSYLSCKDAKELNIKFNKDDIAFPNYIEVCFHEYESDGLLAWEYLKLKKDYVTHKELLKLENNIRKEVYKDNKNYYKEYLKICILLIDLTKKNYNIRLRSNEVNDKYVLYDKELDEKNNEILICNHLYEEAGESVWDLFDLCYPMVGVSFFDKKRNCLVKELAKK